MTEETHDRLSPTELSDLHRSIDDRRMLDLFEEQATTAATQRLADKEALSPLEHRLRDDLPRLFDQLEKVTIEFRERLFAGAVGPEAGERGP